jgi:predicted DNA-binding transcriptional regulator YafY
MPGRAWLAWNTAALLRRGGELMLLNAWPRFYTCATDIVLSVSIGQKRTDYLEFVLRRGDRLFEIIQLLRSAARPLTAAQLAAALEVNVRTVYRDIAALQARRVPIEGATGLGYVLRDFDLPPLMFTADEIEAITVGARLVRRTGDTGLQRAAESVLSKVRAVVPTPLRDQMRDAPFLISDHGAPAVDVSQVREAIRERRKLRITYVNRREERTSRVIRPVAVAYFVEVTLIAAWCELRRDYRHFRADRVAELTVLAETFSDSGELLRRWLEQRSRDYPDRTAVAPITL